MDFRTIYDYNFCNKNVLLRVDFNVPLNEQGDVTNDKRIRETLPTIKYLQCQRAKIIILTHIGRPKKRVKELQTDGVAHRLSQILHTYVKKIDSCIGEEAKKAIAEMKPGEVLMLENVRFYPEESTNNNDFARQLAMLADYFVLDAFGVCHRKNASVTQIAQFIPSSAGFLLQKEIETMTALTKEPQKPFVTIIGGAKEDKSGVIHNLLPHLDHLMIGGKLANTFLKAAGKKIGASKYDEETLPLAEKLLKQSNKKLLLPVDVIVADTFDNTAETHAVSVDEIPEAWMAVDIGPQTRELYSSLIKDAATIVWAGPIGVFEIDKFSAGTKHIAEAIAQSRGITIIGGGDSAAAVEQFHVAHYMSLVSTGGGASLELLQGAELPGITALIENKKLFKELVEQ
jgi:phosphoglycerate kinase